MQRFIAGFASALIVLAAAAFVAVWFGLVPARADIPPPKIERRMASMSLNATIAREAPNRPYPYPDSPAAVDAGAKLYAQHCAMCHGTAAGDPTMLADGLYVKPPQFVKHGVDDDPEGVTYWKVEHGIRFTAMPSYARRLTEEQIWDVTYFLKNVPDHLPPAAQAEWHKPPVE